jgi:ribonuclease Z
MELIFVGTGSGRTSLNRFHSSLLFRDKNNSILIDCGDGISKALLSQNIPINSISHIVISHYHSDHLAGLPSLLTQMIIQNRTSPIKIYTHIKLIENLESFLEISLLFKEKLNFSLEIIGFDFTSVTKITDLFTFESKQNSHVYNKYKIENSKVNFISCSFLINVLGKKILYTSDIGSYEDLFLFNSIKPDIFITEATHVQLNKVENAITIMNPNKTYLTHIDNEDKILSWYKKLPETQKSKINIAADGNRIQL